MTERSSLFALFHQAEADGDDTGDQHQNGAGQQTQSKGFAEDDNTDDNAGNGFQGAENRGTFRADEEGALLEQHNRAGGNQQREQNAKCPAGGCGGQNEAVSGDADEESADAADEDNVECEQETGKAAAVKSGEQHHIGRKGDSRKQGQGAAGEVEGFLRGVEQADANGAAQNADDAADAEFFAQKENFGNDHEGRIGEVEHGGRAGGNVLIGRKE